jgi:uncharacterized protein (TIGR03437 family)
MAKHLAVLILLAGAALAQNSNLGVTVSPNTTIAVNVPANIPFMATGGTPPYEYTLSGTLPLGLRPDFEIPAFTGTPTQQGTFPVLLTVTDAAGGFATASFSIVVGSNLSIATTTLPAAQAGQSYAVQLAAAGGAPPYFWSLVSGTLPPGFRLDTRGIVGGVAGNAAGTYTFTVQATDAQGVAKTQQLSVTIQAAPAVPTFTAASVVNAASSTAAIAPGEYVTIFGSNLAAASATAGAAPFPSTLGNVMVTLNGNPVRLLSVAAGQINFQVPFGTPVGPANLIVTSIGTPSTTAQIQIAAAAPGIFQSSNGRALVVNEDNTLNSSTKPARSGSIIVLYVTGGGRFKTDVTDGDLASPTQANLLQAPVSATLGGLPAEVLYAGTAPGQGTGLVQVNLRVPAALAPGDHPVVVAVGGVSSNNPAVTVGGH